MENKENKIVYKTNTELKLAQMDKEINNLNRLRDAKLKMKMFGKVFTICFSIFMFLLYLVHQNSAQNVAVIIKEIDKLPATGNANFNESGQMIRISHNQSIRNFDE